MLIKKGQKVGEGAFIVVSVQEAGESSEPAPPGLRTEFGV